MTSQLGDKHGILYVATKSDSYIEEAFISADSVKERCPSMPIALFTDRPQHPLCTLGRFDSIGVVEKRNPFATGWASGLADLEWAEGLFDRLECLGRTPFLRTLHLDTDTLVVTDELPDLFKVLDDVDVALTEAPERESYSRYHYDRRMFNGGLILYRRNEGTELWLREWMTVSERNFRLASQIPLPRVAHLEHVHDRVVRRKLLCNDQISLVEVLSPDVNPFNLKVKILDDVWLHRSASVPQKPLAAKIVHVSRRGADALRSDIENVLKREALTKEICH